MWAIKILCNVVMENSTGCPTTTMTECDVGEWVPEECSVNCDNDYDSAMPYKCGGWQKTKREIECPTVTMTDCDVGDWIPEESSVSCDNSYDSAMPYKCGGWQGTRREIVVHNVVTEKSTEPTATMTDCDVGEWVPEECLVSCDKSHDSAMSCNTVIGKR